MRTPKASIRSEITTDLADRLSMTSQDRRLESKVLLELIRSADNREGLEAMKTSSNGRRKSIEAPIIGDQYQADQHAVSIAEFLARKLGADSYEQKIFIAELAVEIAQRIAEEFPRG